MTNADAEVSLYAMTYFVLAISVFALDVPVTDGKEELMFLGEGKNAKRK